MADDKKVCTRCKLPVWTHELWPCTPRHMGEYVGDDDMRREVVLRELNQGALAGMQSEVTERAADLVLAVVNRYDEWNAARLSSAPRLDDLHRKLVRQITWYRRQNRAWERAVDRALPVFAERDTARAEVARLSAEPDEAAIKAAEDVLYSAEVQMPYRVRAAEFVSLDSDGAERAAEFASMHAAEDEASVKNREIVRQAIRAAIRALRPEGDKP